MSHTHTAKWLGILVGGACACTLIVSPARAQEGFALDRFQSAAAGSDWFSGDSLDFRGHGRGALSLTMNYAHEPLVALDSEGQVVAAPVENQMLVHLGGSVNLYNRLRLELMLPLSVWNRGEAATVGGVQYPEPTQNGAGDLRLGADLRLVGEYGKGFSLALGTRVHLPTGTKDAYTSDGATRWGGHLMAAGDLAWFAYSARIGATQRFEQVVVDGATLGTELDYAATAGVRFAKRKALIGVEWYGNAGLTGDSAFEIRSLPQEVLGAFSYRIGDVMLGLAGGAGLTEGLGSPEARGLARLVWAPLPKEPPPPPPKAPPPSPPDCDGDGIINIEDACPGLPGPAADDPEKNGCPLPLDRDHDGIIDSEDACPLVAGKSSADPLQNGCPEELDRDYDGILDVDDACPREPGPKNADPAKHGCPIVVVQGDKITILQRVEFVTARSTIEKESYPLLDEVAMLLRKHPELILIEVEGHTDNVGVPKYNRRLSQQRAESVKSYLIDHGVEKERLVAAGRGPDMPLVDNDTEEGRATNRRVEFHIRERKKVDAQSDEAGSAEKVEE